MPDMRPWRVQEGQHDLVDRDGDGAMGHGLQCLDRRATVGEIEDDLSTDLIACIVTTEQRHAALAKKVGQLDEEVRHLASKIILSCHHVEGVRQHFSDAWLADQLAELLGIVAGQLLHLGRDTVLENLGELHKVWPAHRGALLGRGLERLHDLDQEVSKIEELLIAAVGDDAREDETLRHDRLLRQSQR